MFGNVIFPLPNSPAPASALPCVPGPEKSAAKGGWHNRWAAEGGIQNHCLVAFFCGKGAKMVWNHGVKFWIQDSLIYLLVYCYIKYEWMGFRFGFNIPIVNSYVNGISDTENDKAWNQTMDLATSFEQNVGINRSEFSWEYIMGIDGRNALWNGNSLCGSRTWRTPTTTYSIHCFKYFKSTILSGFCMYTYVN